MKKFDLILLKNEKPYTKNNLKNNMHGIILDTQNNVLEVLFFNPQNQGDYIIVKVNAKDIVVEKEKLPERMVKELNEKVEKLKTKPKEQFETFKIKSYDTVELLVENSEYTKLGIHKGAIGCVMDDNAVQNYVEVDFSGIDNNGNYYGDCISVKIDDLKVIE